MNTRRVRFLREILLTGAKGKDTITYEFSYDDGGGRAPHFFGVPDKDLPQAQALYASWGGSRVDGCRYGSMVRGGGPPGQSGNP